MGFFTGSQPATLSLTIRNSVIVAALYDKNSTGEKPYFTTWCSITSPAHSYNLDTLRSALRNVLCRVITHGTQSSVTAGKQRYVAAVTISIGAPSVVTVARRGHLHFKNPTVVTEDHIKSISFDVRRSAVNELAATMGDKFFVIAAHTAAVTVNGYPTSKPIGNSATHVELTRYLSVIQNDLLAAIETEVAEQFQSARVTTVPLLGVLSEHINTAYHSQNGIIADFDARAVAIAVANENIIRDIETVSYGIDDAACDTAEYFGIPLTMVLSALSARSSRGDIIAYYKNELTNKVSPSMKNIATRTQTVPQTIFLHAAPHQSAIMGDVIVNALASELHDNVQSATVITLPYWPWVSMG